MTALDLNKCLNQINGQDRSIRAHLFSESTSNISIRIKVKNLIRLSYMARRKIGIPLGIFIIFCKTYVYLNIHANFGNCKPINFKNYDSAIYAYRE